MQSLRTRLTFSFAILVATVLVVAVGTLTAFSVGLRKQEMSAEIASAAHAARSIVEAAGVGVSDGALRDEIERRVRRPGLLVIGVRRGGFPPLWSSDRHAHASRPTPSPFGFQPAHDGAFRAPDWRMPLLLLLEPPPQIVPLRDDVIIIAVDHTSTLRALRTYLEGVSVVVGLVVIAAWFVAGWVTRQAIEPLLAVTARLDRFARGDFSPQALSTSDRSEIGDLIEAYNGAATQVAKAFAERAAVEEHMRRFVADAGHELRTPLSVIVASFEVLRKGGIDDEAMRGRVFANLESETKRMNALVERLVALARLERPQRPVPEAVDVVSLIREVTGAVRAARGGDVVIDAPSAAVAYIDHADACDALGNLIDNALKYGAEGPVAIAVETNADTVVVTVRDHGPGIPPGDRPHVFERFYRGWVGRTQGGSGLGLAIAKSAADRAGGALALRCGEPGQTCFALALPRPPGDGAPSAHA